MDFCTDNGFLFWTVFDPSLKQLDQIFMGWIFCIISCKVVPQSASWLRFPGTGIRTARILHYYAFPLQLSHCTAVPCSCFAYMMYPLSFNRYTLVGCPSGYGGLSIGLSSMLHVRCQRHYRHHDAGIQLAATLFNTLRQRATRAVTSHSHTCPQSLSFLFSC